MGGGSDSLFSRSVTFAKGRPSRSQAGATPQPDARAAPPPAQTGGPRSPRVAAAGPGGQSRGPRPTRRGLRGSVRAPPVQVQRRVLPPPPPRPAGAGVGEKRRGSRLTTRPREPHHTDIFVAIGGPAVHHVKIKAECLTPEDRDLFATPWN